MKVFLFTICIAISFLVTFFVLPNWRKRAVMAGLIGADMNKYQKPKIAEVGGITVVAGMLAGILAYVAIKTFYFKSIEYVIEILAFVCTILLTTLVGLIDDILGWKIGLRQYQKPILCLFAAIPLAVINAGESTITLPFLGTMNVSLIYPLILIPLGIMGAANAFNMLAGYNGLEAGMGIIILSTLGIFQLRNVGYIDILWVGVIAFSAVAALIAFFIYNKFPAKIFPGDTLTYSIGAVIASVAILGNLERIALILFIPYFIELLLKARGRLRKESFASPRKDNSLEAKGVYGLGHVAIRILQKIKPSKKVYETDVVLFLLGFELLLAFIVVILYL